MLAKSVKFSVFILALAVLSTVGAFAVQIAFAAWTQPSQNPPNGNTAAPIFSGADATLGALTLNGANLYLNQITNARFYVDSKKGVQIRLDYDQNDSSTFAVNNGSNNEVFSIDENGNVTITGGQIKITGGAPGAGKVLTSDAAGLASWQPASATGVTGDGTANYVSKWLTASALTNSTIYDNGTNVGIGTASPGAKLEVNGDMKLSGAGPTYKVTNVAVPVASSDAATKGYVDSHSTPAGGLYGYCSEYDIVAYPSSSYCSAADAPAYCVTVSNGTACACPSGYTQRRIFYLYYASDGSWSYIFTCYKQ